MQILKNGTPQAILHGVDDQSIPPLVLKPVTTPIHLPLSFTFASEGPENQAFRVSGDNAKALYGRDIFALDSDFATFNTPFISMFNENANTQMMQRVVPDDAAAASIRVYIEMLKTDVPVFEREDDGSYKYGPDKQPVQTGTVPGVTFTLHTGMFSAESGLYKQGKTFEGSQTGSTGEKSRIFPIFDFPASSRGRRGNDRGFRLACLNAKTISAVDPDMVSSMGARTFSFQAIECQVPGLSPSIVRTLDGSTSLLCAFKPNAYYRGAKMKLDAEKILIPAYRNMNPEPGMPPVLSAFEGMHVYRSNLELCLNEVKTVLNSEAAGAAGIEDIYMIDFLTGLDIDGNPYNGFIVDNGAQGGVVFSEKHNHYMTGGSDGTLTNEMFDQLVRKEMLTFGDGAVNYLDMLRYPCRFIWDSGYSMETKEALCNFMARRKDTVVGLTTHVFGRAANDMQTENSMKIALEAMLAANPESPKYGTAAFRGFVMGHSYLLHGSQWEHRVPALYTLANYTSKYAGAGEGGFNPAARFDRGEFALVTEGYDINLSYKPLSTYSSDWEAGLINIRSFDEYRFFIPALYTVYPNDRSILNGYLNSIIAADLEGVAQRAWAEMSGSQSLTDGQIAKMVREKILAAVKDKYDNVVTIEVEPYFTDQDKSNGYSISVDIIMKGNVIKTVHQYTIVAKRRED